MIFAVFIIHYFTLQFEKESISSFRGFVTTICHVLSYHVTA